MVLISGVRGPGLNWAAVRFERHITHACKCLKKAAPPFPVFHLLMPGPPQGKVSVFTVPLLYCHLYPSIPYIFFHYYFFSLLLYPMAFFSLLLYPMAYILSRIFINTFIYNLFQFIILYKYFNDI